MLDLPVAPQFLGPEAGQQAGGIAEGKQVQAHDLGDMRTILYVALTQPGVMNQACRAPHNYSIGNQLLATLQILDRGPSLTPIASFKAWREKGRCVKKGEKAISPLNPLKHKTRFHEMAQVVLGHTAVADMHNDETLSRQIEEAEAEGVACLPCALLDLPGQAESRFYVQSWLQGEALPEKSAKRIFGASDRIMKAGQPTRH